MIETPKQNTKEIHRLVASGEGEMGPHPVRQEGGKCRICDGTLVPALRQVTDSLTGELFDVDRCPQCGVGQTAPFPADLEPYYASYHGDRHGLTDAYRMLKRQWLVQRFAPKGNGNRLLDVGCGEGSFLRAAQKSGWLVSGTELKPEVPRAAGFDVRSEIDQFDPREPFHCITFWHSLEHLTDPRRSLAQAHDRLAPGGVVVISVPDNAGWQARLYGRYWVHLDVPRHLFHFDRPSLARLLATTGFQPVRLGHVELEYDLLGWSQSALNRIGPEANLFFHSLTGKPVGVGNGMQAAHVGLGLLLTAAALPLVVLGTLSRRGGTLVVVARRES